jgi:hypothetical protein
MPALSLRAGVPPDGAKGKRSRELLPWVQEVAEDCVFSTKSARLRCLGPGPAGKRNPDVEPQLTPAQSTLAKTTRREFPGHGPCQPAFSKHEPLDGSAPQDPWTTTPSPCHRVSPISFSLLLETTIAAGVGPAGYPGALVCCEGHQSSICTRRSPSRA